MYNKSYIIAFLTMFATIANTIVKADDTESEFSWPIEIESEDGKFITTLYQPQLESFESSILEGRMAVTLKPKDKDMIFGALWFKARLLTDFDTRIVVLEKLDITKTHFPDIVDEENINKFSKLLEEEIESWSVEMSLDRILASLDEVENLKVLSDQINNDPPAIYFRKSPAILILTDGDPILKEDEKAGVEYVVNTPYFIVKEIKKEDYYITDGTFWYTSKEILKGWEATKKPPSKVKKFADENAGDIEPDSLAQTYTEAPELILDTKAAELILVDGEADYKPIEYLCV